MMDIVVLSILLIVPLQWIPRQSISAMVVDALHHTDCAKTCRLPDGKAGEHKGERRANCVEEEGFGDGIVECTEGIWDVYFVVVSMHVA